MELVTISEAAKVLQLCEATVRARVKAGVWPVYDFGERSVRLDLDEIKRMVRKAGTDGRRLEEPVAAKINELGV